MSWDVAIALLLAVLAAFVSGMAGHLAVTKTWQKWFFWGSGVLMVGLIALQSYRNAITHRDLEDNISKIQKNTEPPPIVNVSPPRVNVEPQITVPTNRVKAYVDFDHLELNWVRKESTLIVNSYAVNRVVEPARNVNATFALRFISAVKGLPTRQNQEEAVADFEKRPYSRSAFRGVLGPGQQMFGTMTVTFDQQLLDQINSGKRVLMVIGRISFSDDNGPHRKEYCQFVQPPLFATPTSTVVTHFCDSHNDLKY